MESLEEEKQSTFQNLLDSLEIHSAVKKAVAKERLVFPTALQSKLIPLVLEGQKHILVKYEDNSGIKLGFLLPILQSFLSQEKSEFKMAVILAHNKKRINEISEYATNLTVFCKEVVNIKTATKPDSVNTKELPQILVTNPKVLLPLLANQLVANAITILIIDQVDFHLQMDFKEELQKIGKLVSETDPQIVMTVKSVEDTDETIQEIKKSFMEAALVVRFKQSTPLIGTHDI